MGYESNSKYLQERERRSTKRIVMDVDIKVPDDS